MQKLFISDVIDSKVVLKTRTRDEKGHFNNDKGISSGRRHNNPKYI